MNEAAPLDSTYSAGQVDESQLDDYQLEDRYRRQSGRVFLTGTQALIRIPLMQAELDRRGNLRKSYGDAAEGADAR